MSSQHGQVAHKDSSGSVAATLYDNLNHDDGGCVMLASELIFVVRTLKVMLEAEEDGGHVNHDVSNHMIPPAVVDELRQSFTDSVMVIRDYILPRLHDTQRTGPRCADVVSRSLSQFC